MSRPTVTAAPPTLRRLPLRWLLLALALFAGVVSARSWSVCAGGSCCAAMANGEDGGGCTCGCECGARATTLAETPAPEAAELPAARAAGCGDCRIELRAVDFAPAPRDTAVGSPDLHLAGAVAWMAPESAAERGPRLRPFATGPPRAGPGSRDLHTTHLTL